MSVGQSNDMNKLKNNFESNMTGNCDVKYQEQINFSSLPPGAENKNRNSKHSAKDFDDHCERKKKTRRGKPKRKKPYNKDIAVTRVKNFPKSKSNCSRFRHRQPVAPNNTNEFLMEDHKDLQLQELDERLQATANKATEGNMTSRVSNPNRPARVRDSSFTSADSGEDYFYSSPEDEEEFLTKDFSDTYEVIHAESLQKLSKSQLIQNVLHLESKNDILEQKLSSKNNSGVRNVMSTDETDYDRTFPEKSKTDAEYEKEIERLKMLNDQLGAKVESLQRQNESLKRQLRSSSVSSVDSESDSSTTSGTSGSASIEMKYDEIEDFDNSKESNFNEVMVPQGICSMESEDVT